jgi:hypothetical protein
MGRACDLERPRRQDIMDIGASALPMERLVGRVGELGRYVGILVVVPVGQREGTVSRDRAQLLFEVIQVAAMPCQEIGNAIGQSFTWTLVQ